MFKSGGLGVVKSYLPSEQELIAEIERSKLYLEEKIKNNAFQ